MKIFEGEHEFMTVYEVDGSGDIVLETHRPHSRIYLTPLEAMELSKILEKVCHKTEYFKGFAYNERTEQ